MCAASSAFTAALRPPGRRTPETSRARCWSAWARTIPAFLPSSVPTLNVRCAKAEWTGGCIFMAVWRSEEHTSELQSLMRISYAVFCLKKKKKRRKPNHKNLKLKNTITQTKKTKKSNIKLEKRKQTKSAINHTYRTKVDKHKTT